MPPTQESPFRSPSSHPKHVVVWPEREPSILRSSGRLREVQTRNNHSKRYVKRLRNQRFKILLDPWPNMVAAHRSDIQGDLYQPMTLPLLLNAHGRNPPSDFAGADADFARLRSVIKAIVSLFLNRYTMLLNRFTENTMKKYGTLIFWDDYKDAPGPEPEPEDVIESTGFEYLAVMTAEAPYRLPAKLDLGRIESIYVEMFSELQQQPHYIRTMQAKYANTISSTKDLPKDYLKALVKFCYFLNKVDKGHLSQLKIAGPSAPPVRHFVDFNKMNIMTIGHPRSKVENNMAWLLNMLWEDGQALFLAGMRLTVDEPERLIEIEPEAKQLISPYIVALIGDFSFVTKCIRQLDTYHLWASGFENVAVDLQDQIDNEYGEASQAPGGFIATKNIYYPIDKRRTKENIEVLREAESNLDTLWGNIDSIMYKVEPEPKKDHARASGDKSIPIQLFGVESLYKPLLTLYFDAVAKIKKYKVKTKGTPAPTTATEEEEDLAVVEKLDKQPTFSIDAPMLKIPWTGFLHAMVSVGFLAQFQSTRLDVERAIQCHEPHPRGKIPLWKARWHERSLKRVYGWLGGKEGK
ncbi:hypothetical protein QBC36DRAFT_347406 [Triangularia setosa]|uniref:Uncharacterized protein n=1 Tax=Triangularia setosa TaxID=2587417 RepID=A0AAN6W647_9PEZI|nr:hypothetical protein QBC36DRAFT_347406 [Podospora setosa]